MRNLFALKTTGPLAKSARSPQDYPISLGFAQASKEEFNAKTAKGRRNGRNGKSGSGRRRKMKWPVIL